MSVRLDLSQSECYSMTDAILILLSSRGAESLALQLLMSLLAQLRAALMKGFGYK